MILSFHYFFFDRQTQKYIRTFLSLLFHLESSIVITAHFLPKLMIVAIVTRQ